ncbi:MAG: hypothetical protein EHM53_12660, partial [Methanoregulaceae archaeon]
QMYGDRRVVPVCIAGSLFPDLLDKPLMLLIPGIVGSTRTIGHTLLLASAILLAALILWYRSRSVPGIAFAGTVLLHQLLDMLWTLPVTWFFPLRGMFPMVPASGGFLQFLWLELTNLSEWVFALASCILLLSGYAGIFYGRPSLLSGRTTGILRYGTACLLGITGFFLIIAGLDPVAGTLPALYPGPDKTLMAGLVALCGAIVFIMLPGRKRSEV